jgi:hypothetical protein
VEKKLKPYRWSSHALKNLADREISRAEPDEALANPEAIVPARPGRRFFMRRYFDSRFQQEMLVRALVEETAQEQAVIAVYITSKVGKYMKGVP